MTFLSIFAGVLIALQSAMSGQLSAITKNPPWTTLLIYLTSSIVMGLYLIVSKTRPPNSELLKLVPTHLWFTGAFLSVLALTLVYWQMPKIGVARVMSGVLTGQLCISILAAHFGWFGLPVTAITIGRLSGFIFMLIGVFLINGSSK